MKRNVFSVSSKRRRTLGCWGTGQSQLDSYWQETLFWKLTLKLCTSCLCFLPLYRNRANVFQHSFRLASRHRLSITIPQLFSRHPSNWWKHLKNFLTACELCCPVRPLAMKCMILWIDCSWIALHSHVDIKIHLWCRHWCLTAIHTSTESQICCYCWTLSAFLHFSGQSFLLIPLLQPSSFQLP